MSHGRFYDEHRGDGACLTFRSLNHNWVIAVRWRWNFSVTRPPAKTGYVRVYLGPLEVERSPRARANTTQRTYE